MFSGVFVRMACSQACWDASLGHLVGGRLSASRGPVGPCAPWRLGFLGSPRICTFKWVLDALSLLNDFVRQVVVSRGDAGLIGWATWLRDDLGSRPYVWLRPDFVSPSPFLVIKDNEAQTSRILVERILWGLRA